MKTTRILLLGMAACALAACNSTDDERGPQWRPIYGGVAEGPRTAVPDVEVYPDHPVAYFQRTGLQPGPIAVLPADTPVTVRSRSGTFCEVTWAGGSGWVDAGRLAGMAESGPFPEAGTVGDGRTSAGGGPAPATPDDKIDLDRFP